MERGRQARLLAWGDPDGPGLGRDLDQHGRVVGYAVELLGAGGHERIRAAAPLQRDELGVVPGAFLLVAALILLTALVPRIGSLIAAIPPSIAQAMLAGIVMQLCLGPVTGMAANPWAVGPVVIVWVLALRLAPRWASPLAGRTVSPTVPSSAVAPDVGGAAASAAWRVAAPARASA